MYVTMDWYNTNRFFPSNAYVVLNNLLIIIIVLPNEDIILFEKKTSLGSTKQEDINANLVLHHDFYA